MEEITEHIETIILATLFLFCFLVSFFGFLFFYFKKFYKLRAEKNEMRLAFQNASAKAQIEIQEQTLQQVSYELHDNLGQVASLIKINLSVIQFSNPGIESEKLENTIDLTRQLINDIKSLSVSLGNDRIAKIGLNQAIETEIMRLNKTGQFLAVFHSNVPLPEIDTNKELILYRMLQEILNNIVKHSLAVQVDISLETKNNMLILVVKDNGVGFNIEEKINASAGAGLRNLKNRAQLINAQIRFVSSPENGSQVTIEFPL